MFIYSLIRKIEHLIYNIYINESISKRKLAPRYVASHLGKNLTENRVLMLSEKINNLKFGNKAEADRKFETLEKQVEELEVDL
jgi:hypothetical protein